MWLALPCLYSTFNQNICEYSNKKDYNNSLVKSYTKPPLTAMLVLHSVARETRRAPSGGQPAGRRAEPAGAGAVGGDGGVGAEHAPRGAGLQPGGGQDPQGLAGHRETGAHQQGRVGPAGPGGTP